MAVWVNMEIYTVSFFGHRTVENFQRAEIEVDSIIQTLLREKEYVDFLVGRNGDFDQIVSSAIHRAKRMVRSDNSSLVWVMPYPMIEYERNADYYNDYYDSVEVCDYSQSVHYKSAYQKRNRSMVDRSDLALFWIEHPYGGAYQTYRYAKKKEVRCLNISGNNTL